MTIKKSIYKSEGDRMELVDVVNREFYKLKIWAPEFFSETGTSAIRLLVQHIFDLAQEPSIINAKYCQDERLWQLRIRFLRTETPSIFSVDVSELELRSLRTLQCMASDIASKIQHWQRENSQSDQMWEIRSNRDRHILTVQQDEHRIGMTVVNFAFISQPSGPPTVQIVLDIHSDRVSGIQDSKLVVDGITLQSETDFANISSSFRDSRWIVHVRPRVERVEFSEDIDSFLSSCRSRRITKIWTKPSNQEMRSPIPTRRTLQRTAEDGSKIRQSAEAIQSDAEHEQRIRALLSLASQRDLRGYIGDTTCRYNAKNSFLRCAINPCGPCEGCGDYQSNLDESN